MNSLKMRLLLKVLCSTMIEWFLLLHKNEFSTDIRSQVLKFIGEKIGLEIPIKYALIIQLLKVQKMMPENVSPVKKFCLDGFFSNFPEI